MQSIIFFRKINQSIMQRGDIFTLFCWVSFTHFHFGHLFLSIFKKCKENMKISVF
jgi:hypothetical protein